MPELRWYQAESVRSCWDFLCRSPGNPVIMLPTGAGKSLVIAELCREAVERFGGRVLCLAHRKELLQQNAAKIRAACPGLDVGIYSAGLDRRDTDHAVVVAGIQSVFRRAEEFGQRHLVLIDEVHLVPHDGEGMYRTFLDSLRSINPHLRMAGLTATPYRLDAGAICRPDGLFQKVCYSAPVRQLIEEGFLCRLTTRPSATLVDTSGLKLRGGEFIQADTERLFSGVVDEACRELVAKAVGRRACLVFASGVSHADRVATCLEKLTGERVGVVTGDTWPMLREQTLADFRAGRLRWCVNVDVLTTGFDAPNIDCIGVLRATMSPGLFAQIVGRGFRVHPDKTDGCLILDFGGNIARHGPIDSPDYGVQDKRQRVAGEAPVKRCPNCETECLIAATECGECGWQFPRDREASHDAKPDESQILSEPEVWLVEAVRYATHYKRKDIDAPPTLRVDYECRKEGTEGNLSSEVISEWICLEHEGFALKKARRWWTARSVLEPPETIQEAVELCRRGAVAAPRSIVAVKEGRFWRVLSAVLDERPEEWASELGEVDPFAVEMEVAF